MEVWQSIPQGQHYERLPIPTPSSPTPEESGNKRHVGLQTLLLAAPNRRMFLFSWDNSSLSPHVPYLSNDLHRRSRKWHSLSRFKRADTKDFLWPGSSRMRTAQPRAASPDRVWNIWLLAQAVGWLSGLFEHKLAWESLCRMLLEAFSVTSAN